MGQSKGFRRSRLYLSDLWCSWTTGKRLIGVLNACLILSDSKYEGWQPEREDLIDIESGLLCFVDKDGKVSLKEGQEGEERETDSHRSTSFENTPSPWSVPSVERSTSGSSSSDLPAGSPDSSEGAAKTQMNLGTAAANEVIQPGPGPMQITEQLKSAVPAAVQPPGTSGGQSGPPPQEGRFFNNPMNIRTLMTGSGDGYRSPEPSCRLDTLSPLHHTYTERTMSSPMISGFDLSGTGTAAERTGPSTFSAHQPAVIQPPNNPGPGMEYGYEALLSSSSVLPAELMVYNDLMMDLGTGQYLGNEAEGPGPLPFTHPSVDGDTGINGYQWQGMSQHIPQQEISTFGYPQPGQPHHGVNQASEQQAGTSFGGQWPTRGIVDYRWGVSYLASLPRLC